MITESEPKDWKDLQNQTGQILTESGLKVEIEKKVVSVRGEIEIDVFAIETINDREQIILIECKNWNNPIPQTVVHAFRTVMTDIGANTGYIVSKTGFQSGAYKTSEFSNIKLVTWKEFQDLFESQWKETQLSEYIEKNWGALMSYVEPLVPNWALFLSDSDTEKYKKLFNQYQDLGWLLLLLRSQIPIFGKKKNISLPLCDNNESGNIPPELLKIKGYKELIVELHKHCDLAISEFREIKKRVIKKDD